MSTGTILKTVDLAAGYRRRAVLEHVDLEIGAGDFWFFLGPNGEGKTTLFRTLLGILEPLRGRIERAAAFAAPGFTAFVPQRASLNPTLPLSVHELLSLGLARLRVRAREARERIESALDRVGLGGLADHSYWSLSGGQRQRALVARALVRRPGILFVDEPTAGLDLGAEETLLQSLEALRRTEGLTVLFITHELGLAARHATHVALFTKGRVLPGTAGAMLEPNRLADIWGVPVDLMTASCGVREGSQR
jgi:ABC-type Mn2+/Zn2+ transport system ATPase subunit